MPVAANDLPSGEWRTATGMTPSRWRQSSRLGRRAEPGRGGFTPELGGRSRRVGDFDKDLARLDHLLSIWKGTLQHLFQIRVRRIATSYPQDHGRRAESFLQQHEIDVLRHHSNIRLSRLMKDAGIFGAKQIEIPNAIRFDSKLVSQPRRQSR
jgi:hypothetical protein